MGPKNKTTEDKNANLKIHYDKLEDDGDDDYDDDINRPEAEYKNHLVLLDTSSFIRTFTVAKKM